MAISTASDEVVHLPCRGRRLGERGLLRDGKAMLNRSRRRASDAAPSIPAADFLRLMSEEGGVRALVRPRRCRPSRAATTGPMPQASTALSVADMMAKSPGDLCGRRDRDRGRPHHARPGHQLGSGDGGRGPRGGIVTVHDLNEQGSSRGASPGAIPVADVMTRKVRTVSPDATGLPRRPLVEMANHRHLFFL